MAIGTYISIIVLNVNGLNAPTKIHRLSGYKNKSHIYILSIRNPLQTSRYIRLQVGGWKTILHANGKQKKAGAAIFISDQIELKTNKITRDKEGHYIMIEGSIQEEDITIVNIHVLNTGAPQYIRQTLTNIKGEYDSNTIIVGDFNTPFTPVDRSSKQN